MAPFVRPEGTDGSDHSYREKVEDMYKGMPVWRAAGWLFLHFTSIPLLAKIAWAFIPYYIDGYFAELGPFIFAGLYAFALLMWTLAKPATYKESLTFVKLTNCFVLFLVAMQIIVGWKYHLMDTQQSHFPRRLWKFLSEEKGWKGARWQDAFTVAEALVDSSLLIMSGGAAVCLHNYITRKMLMDKKIAQSKKKDGDAAASKPAIKAPPAAAAKKRPGRA